MVNNMGECRNRSPVVDPQAYAGMWNGEVQRAPQTFWPKTHFSDYCGDHLESDIEK